MATARAGAAAGPTGETYSTGIVFAGAGTCAATLLGLLAFGNPQLEGLGLLVDKGLAIAFMSASFGAYRLLSNAFSSLRGELASNLIAVLGALAFCAGNLGVPASPAVRIACDCAAAMGASALLVIWSVDLHLRPRDFPTAHIAGAFAIATAVVLAEFFFEAEVRTMAQIGVWALSCALSLSMYRLHKLAGIPAARFDNKKAVARSRIRLESHVMMATTYALFGFVLGMGHVDVAQMAPFALATSLVTCLVIAISDAVCEPVVSERSIYLATVPATTSALACTFLLGDGAMHVIAMCTLACFNSMYLVLGSVALTDHIRLERLPPVRAFGTWRSFHYAAAFAGMALGAIAGMAYADDPLAGLRLTVAMALAYCLIGTLFHRVRTPDSTLGPVGHGASSAAGGFERRVERCNELRERYGLSDRQYEVLCLISQGRNAEYVAESLVISLSTVQTHIRNIYKKLGVHSRQELLDLVENTKLYGED